MSSITKKIELMANIAIIIVALLIGTVLVRNYLAPKPSHPPSEITAGTKLPVEDINWEKNGQTLLLVLQKGCHFCSESAPFYQRLVRGAEKSGNTRIVAVLPQEIDEGKKYLSDLGVPIGEVKQAGLATIGVRGTPTLILVDKAGAVTDSWVGKLTAEGESKVLERLQVKSVASR